MRTIFLILGMCLVFFHSSLNELRANPHPDCSSAVHAFNLNHYSEISFFVGSDLLMEDDEQHVIKEKKCVSSQQIHNFIFSELTNAFLRLGRTNPPGKNLSFQIPIYLRIGGFKI